MLNTFRSSFLAAVAAIAFLLAAPAHAGAYVDYTDLWVDVNPPANSGNGGFGINFVQSGNGFDYIFATFFIYDPATGGPTWVTGDLQRASGKTSFSGNIYHTQGEPTSGPFAPKNTVTSQIGTFTFTPATPTTGTLVYVVNSVTTTLNLKRLTLTENKLDGSYWGQATIKRSNCSISANNGLTFNRIFLDVAKNTGSSQVTYTFSIENYSCTMKGTLIQEGRFQKINGAKYTCYDQGGTKLSDGSANIFNIAATTQGIEGEWTSGGSLGGCAEETHFVGVLQP